MKTDHITILIIFSVIGGFIFIKGFQSNLEIIDIATIFVTFISFLMCFVLLTALINNFMTLVSNVLFKK